MSAENKTLIINSHPLDSLIALGNGSLLQGVATGIKISEAIKKPWHNMVMVSGTDTVGADTLVNIIVHTYQPFLLTGINLNNSVTTTTFTSLKVNGELISPRGMSASSSGVITIANLVTDAVLDWIVFIPADSDIELVGTATQNDVVTATFFGLDMNFATIGG